jgi:hypothetical protein
MAFKGMTWPVEGGLDNGVVCRQVVPFDCVTNLCHHVVRVELEATATAAVCVTPVRLTDLESVEV